MKSIIILFTLIAGYHSNLLSENLPNFGEECTTRCREGLICLNQKCVCSCEVNACNNNQCENNSTCIITGSNYSCICPHGYGGLRCENDPCFNVTCLNNGQCIVNDSSFYCKCINGFSGEFCTNDICTPNPCVFGTCHSNSENEILCNCLDGFFGPLCSETPCSNYTCFNNGTCVVSIDGPVCECTPPYTGVFCKDFCSSNLCQNGGTCIDKGDYYTCECYPEFTGTNCELSFCGNLTYILNDTNCCLDNLIVSSCCNNVGYNSTNQECCSGQIINNLNEACCNKIVINKTVSTCCENSRIIPIADFNCTKDYFNLLNYWPLDSDTKDKAGNASFTDGNNFNFSEGVQNKALVLNNGSFRIPAGSYFAGRDFTVMAWVRLTANISNTKLLEFNAFDTQISFVLTLNNGFGLAIKKLSPSPFLVNSNISLPLNIWSHVAYTMFYRTGHASLYLNSTFAGFRYVKEYLTNNTNFTTNFIGTGLSSSISRNIRTPNANVIIDDLKIFKKVLNQTEISTEM